MDVALLAAPVFQKFSFGYGWTDIFTETDEGVFDITENGCPIGIERRFDVAV